MITYEEAKKIALNDMPEADTVVEYESVYVFYNSKAKGPDTEDNEVVIEKKTGRIISYSEYVATTDDDPKIQKKWKTNKLTEEEIKSLYKEYLKLDDHRWEYGNGILYRMCEENPKHDSQDVVVGKIWLIGRSYAAAIERRKNAYDENDEFYYDVVASLMIDIGPTLDNDLDKLRRNNGTIREDVVSTLNVHDFLTKAFYKITGLEKRSLASKYLHFHCPDKFFIYDSRAKEAVGKLIKKADRSIVDSSCGDNEYRDFVCRMIELQDILTEVKGERPSPREMDNFLLYFYSSIS